jgi:hypothetical protein
MLSVQRGLLAAYLPRQKNFKRRRWEKRSSKPEKGATPVDEETGKRLVSTDEQPHAEKALSLTFEGGN